MIQKIAENIRDVDIFARWGGEEFMILMPNANLDNASRVAEKLRKGVPQSAAADPGMPLPMIHMPAWGEKLSDDEIDSLVEYLFSLRPEGGEDDWAW